MTTELVNRMESTTPPGGPLWARWCMYLVTNVGAPLLFAGVLCWYVFQIQNDYKAERQTAAEKTERLNERVLTAFEASATANAKLAQAIRDVVEERKR